MARGCGVEVVGSCSWMRGNTLEAGTANRRGRHTGKYGGQLDVGQLDVGPPHKGTRTPQPTAQASRHRSIGHRSMSGICIKHKKYPPRFPTWASRCLRALALLPPSTLLWPPLATSKASSRRPSRNRQYARSGDSTDLCFPNEACKACEVQNHECGCVWGRGGVILAPNPFVAMT